MKVSEIKSVRENFSEVEYSLREKMIGRIESIFGTLESMPYSQISTEDLSSIYLVLVQKNIVRSIGMPGFGSIETEEDLSRFLGESAGSTPTEAKEYARILKKHGYSRQPSGNYYRSVGAGVIKINKHGHWEHIGVDKGYEGGAEFEGTNPLSLDRHLINLLWPKTS